MSLRKLALLAALLAACQGTPSPTPAALSAPSVTPLTLHQPPPTQTPRPIFASLTPSVVPQDTATPLPTSAPLAAPTQTAVPPAQMLDGQHLLLEWPLLYGAAAFNRAYPYGDTNGQRLQVHHGDDLVRPTGTPILAAADGTVFYAGSDFIALFGPYNNYYGNLVVIQHPFLSLDGLPIYTLYGHMEQVLVTTGQVVREGQQIGVVGATGIALGPHLHFEVRLGDPHDFNATRNPELWLRPPGDHGVLAGRVTDASGGLVSGANVSIRSASLALNTPTYADLSVTPDDVLGENFDIGDLPPDSYVVTARKDDRGHFQQAIHIGPEQVTWIDVQISP